MPFTALSQPLTACSAPSPRILSISRPGGQLCDFGLARSLAEGPVGGDPCGTPTYMAPESLKMTPHGTPVRPLPPRDFRIIHIVNYFENRRSTEGIT